MEKSFLGIDAGSTNLKLYWRRTGQNVQPKESFVIFAHEGNLSASLEHAVDKLKLFRNSKLSLPQVVVTGTEGRHRFCLPQIISPVAIEKALQALNLNPKAVVSMGGEDLVVYALNRKGRIVSTYAGNKCASGTGEFFRQQLGRMDLKLGDIPRVAQHAQVFRLSARCSVFMKSDCTHRLNKGEANKGDIVLSLTKLMADKVSEFLIKAKISQGQIVLIGGVIQNKFLVDFLTQEWPDIEFIVPIQAAYFEAFGAALAAETSGQAWSDSQVVMRERAQSEYDNFQSLDAFTDHVQYIPSLWGEFDPTDEYILGVDGGSTTTKVALLSSRTLKIVAAHYGRTHGDPIDALKDCLKHIRQSFQNKDLPRIRLVATTGSSRELLGVFLETPSVYNEIIAHTVGTLHFEEQVDTIFEIGGQDAKYVHINNGVPIDYAMNEACSAGTGSFLEESAQGDLNVNQAEKIGPIAMQAKAPLKFGEHCSAFINSDIRKAIQQGAPREDIVAGLVFSIVANYLNRVVGNRHIGEKIVLQGGVAKNPSIPLAFAQMLKRQIIVPPDPELMGCFGVARLVQQKHEAGLVAHGKYDLDILLAKDIQYKNSFACKACENYCVVKNVQVGEMRYPFGGRCSKYTNQRKKRRESEKPAIDYTLARSQMLFTEYAPKADTFRIQSDKVVGVPVAFSVHSLWPLYAWFFHSLGVKTVLSDKVSLRGIAKQESSYCYPTEIAHGAIQDVIDKKVDYLFLPHFRDMPSMEKGEVHACLCPLTQGLPFFARHAFALKEEQILRPLVSFKHGWLASQDSFSLLSKRLGFSRPQGEAAYQRAVAKYLRFLEAYRKLGQDVIEKIHADPEQIHIALLGRPYNAFCREANMGIPQKISSQGVSVVPFDFLYQAHASILPNMYWYYGQENMKTVARVRDIPNLYLTWISNFSCAPDSFMLHYVRWMMGQKPYLVLEIDSHTADAGLDTRIEAFLDIVESYRRNKPKSVSLPAERRYTIETKNEYCDIVDNQTHERIDIRDPRITLVWPSMGDLSVEVLQRATSKQGIRSLHLPLPDIKSTQLARNVASGKECIPALLVLGSVLQFFQKHPPNQKDEIYVVFVPSTLGPCRTGQYHIFYERVFADCGFNNVVQLVAQSENSYREMGPTFNRDIWWSILLGDYFTDIRTGIHLLAANVDNAMTMFEQLWQRILKAMAQDNKQIEHLLKEATQILKKIPKARTLEEVKKVLIVGEIYVRRDNFSVHELSDFLLKQGIFPKITGVSEWVHYTDYARKFLMDEKRKREGLRHTLNRQFIKDEAMHHIELMWKHWVERKIHDALKPTGFLPDVPHNMKAIIEKGRKVFIEPDLESEATVSPAVGKAALEDGYAGVAVIAPFGCLPGRLIEGVFSPWAKARGYPVIALENDGQPYPPNTISRIEVFAHNVNRFERTN